MAINGLVRSFTIRARMLGAIVIVLALLLVVGGTGLYGMYRLQQAASINASALRTNADGLGQLRGDFGNARRFEKDVALNLWKTDQVKVARERWNQSLATMDKTIDALLEGREDANNAVLRKLRPALESYQSTARVVLDKAEAQGFESPEAVNEALDPARKIARETVDPLLAELSEALKTDADAASAENQAAMNQTLILFGAMVLVAVGTVVPLTVLNMQSICRPLVEARRLAEAIAQGQLDQTVQAEGRDETADMLRSLATMQARLRGMVGEIRQSAESIQLASSEVASGNTDLSHRTEQTASNLQQAASSMEQLTGTVKQSADAARTASQLASSAAEVAQRGGTVVSQVVSTMNEIDASSRRIADIIGTIDGIAFQTNILALNAAVEAARAGEQGRGFAVVASEVRSLAQRSAEAAREIKTLIGTSVDKVETGSRLVTDAGSTMNEIVASVQRVSDIIGEISAAASEQSTGIGQVNASVVQLDQMTQQNAALVEESAAAAESMKEQAQKLASVVSAFRIGQADMASSGTGTGMGTTSAPARVEPRPAAPGAKARPDKPVKVARLPASQAAPTPAQVAAREVVQRVSHASRQPNAGTPGSQPPHSSGDGDWETF